MARRPRLDAPDTWHHVMNRGVARRPIFENRKDRRFFLALLAAEVRAGRIEVHAYCLMLTHFHLLVRSVTGELSEAMRRISNRYARWFNRSRERDGPLFRGRFLSYLITDLAYRRTVVTYIHDNAVKPGLVADPADYEWASAIHYVGDERPRWLATGWIDGEIAARGARLATAFPSRLDDDFRHHVAKRLHARAPAELEDETLKYAGSPQVVRWAMRKSRLADGTRPFRPVCPPGLVKRLLDRARKRIGPILGLFASRFKDAWVALRAGLLRRLAGCRHDTIGRLVGRHHATISRDVQDHVRLRSAVPRYEDLAARLAHEILEASR